MTQQAQPPQKSRFAQMFSPRRLQNAVGEVCRRFPFVVVFLGLLTLFAWLNIWAESLPVYLDYAGWVSLTVGLLLSLAAYLWCEYLNVNHKSLLCQLAVLALALANFFYLYTMGPRLSIVEGVGYGAVYTSALIGIFFVPVVRRSSIRLQWNYSCSVVGVLAFGLLISFVMGFFTGAIFGTLNLLFSFSSERLFLSIIVVLTITLPAIVALCFFPKFEVLENDTTDRPKPPLALFCKNVLLPLALIYTLILYVYGIKILVTWNLPNGNVCWTVIGLVSVSLLIVYGMQGFVCNASSKASSKRIASLSIKIIPLLLLPLLVLMSVAIFYRVWQYGITASRLYVATFNIWAYAAVVYMLFSRMPKLNLVASSFAVLFLATSVLPGVNYCTLGLNSVRNSVKEQLVRLGAEDLPVSYEEMMKMLEGQDEKTIESIASNLDYLDDWDDHSAVADIVACDEKISAWKIKNKVMPAVRKELQVDSSYGSVAIPAGYGMAEYIKISGQTAGEGMERIDSARIGTSGVRLPVDSLLALDKDVVFEPVACPVGDGSDQLLVITTFEEAGWKKGYVTITGYLLKK